MTLPEIILLGGGGHCRSCIDVLESAGEFHIAGIVDVPEKVGQRILGYEIFASDEDLPSLAQTYQHCLVTVGQIRSPQLRIRLASAVVRLGFRLPVVVSPVAHVSAHAQLADGTIVMHGAIINSEASVGMCCIVNSGAIIEHESRVGEYCHVSTGAILNGGSVVGDRCFIGSHATLREGVTVAADTLIAAGAVVTADCLVPGTYRGVPAARVP